MSATNPSPNPTSSRHAAARRLTPDLFAVFVYALAAGVVIAEFALIIWLTL